MRKNAILALIIVLVVGIGAYLLWQGNSDSNTIVTPTPNPAPSPVPNPAVVPANQDYKAPFKIYSGNGVSVEYPSSWFTAEPLSDDEVGVISILSPATKQGQDAGTSSGYNFDLNVQKSNDLYKILGNSYTKGADVSVAGKKGYWVLIQGQDTNEGVVVDHKGYYVFSFPPGMDKELQNEILKHIKFTN